MENILTAINVICLALTGGFFFLLVVAAIREREKRAALLSFLLFAADLSVWFIFLAFPGLRVLRAANFLVVGLLLLFGLLSLMKFFPGRDKPVGEDIEPFDERDHMFSRNELRIHPSLADKYYSRHPERRMVDEKFHRKPELGEPGQTYFDPLLSPVFEASFSYLSRTRNATDGDTAEKKKPVDRTEITEAIKSVARFYGAADVGITSLKPYHVYSHAGRHPEHWGEVINLDHKWAVVIVVAMDSSLLKQAPSLPVILESSRQYVEAAKTASIIAEYIRNLGYEARAHTDGNYLTLCVPLAADAGLGEVGRLGVLVHPVLGPCLRISVVTTELELEPSHRQEFSIRHFCRMCKKCAVNCPTQSIPGKEMPESRGFKHWSVNQETCFSYWKTIGTDCGFCIKVCPYTKPDTLVHRLVRFYISRNPVNQRIALFFDDFLYGRRGLLSSVNPRRIFP